MAESALQLFSRLGVKEQLGNLDLPFFSRLSPEDHGGLKAGDVIEFCGTEGTGKSEILLNIVARCVLPKLYQGCKLGKETEVVFISTDHKFDLQRLTNLLESHVSQIEHFASTQDKNSQEYKDLVLSCLARVHVVYCSSSGELTVTLQYLKTFLHTHSRVCALVLDNVASYYWMDKDKFETIQNHWISSLKELIQEYHLIVFASKPLIFHKSTKQWHKETKVEKTLAGNDFMPKLWQRMVKYRFYLEHSVYEQTVSLFIAHQLSPLPAGRVFKFSVTENGLLFM